MPLFLPHQIPSQLPTDIAVVVEELKKSKNQSACLSKAYEILTAKYRGERLKTYLYLPQVFSYDLNKMWSKNGFLHCSNLNYLLKILLVSSGCFSLSDIKTKWTMIWFISPHQYLQVIVDNKPVNIDLWAANHGIKFGDYAHGFH